MYLKVAFKYLYRTKNEQSNKSTLGVRELRQGYYFVQI